MAAETKTAEDPNSVNKDEKATQQSQRSHASSAWSRVQHWAAPSLRRLSVLSVAVAVVVACIAVDYTPHRVLPPGQRVIVCGASTGIGKEVAYKYAALNASLVLIARRQQVLEDVAAECRSMGAIHVAVLAADLADQSSVQHAIEQSIRLLGGLDILILNHIIGYFGAWTDVAMRLNHVDLQQLFAVNTLSYITAATAALPALTASKGTITVVSSAAAKMGMPMVAPYSGTKHALHGFFESLRHDLIRSNTDVKITLCVLGSIDTPNAREATKGHLEHVPRYPASGAAESIVHATTNHIDEAYYPGFIRVLPVINALTPRLAQWIVRSSMEE